MKFVSDLRHVGGFLRVLQFSPPITLDHHNIAEILLKVGLNTIKLYLTSDNLPISLWIEVEEEIPKG